MSPKKEYPYSVIQKRRGDKIPKVYKREVPLMTAHNEARMISQQHRNCPAYIVEHRPKRGLVTVFEWLNGEMKEHENH